MQRNLPPVRSEKQLIAAALIANQVSGRDGIQNTIGCNEGREIIRSLVREV